MLPIVLATVGSMLPVIIDAFRRGKSPEEAARVVAAHRADLVGKMVKAGMDQEQAAVIADEQLRGALEREQMPEAMGTFATAALALAGGIGGFKGGSMLAGKLRRAGAGAAGKTTAGAAAAETVAELPKAPTAREAAVASVEKAQRPPPSIDAEAMAAQTHGRPTEMVDDIAAKLDAGRGDMSFRKSLATKDDGLQGAIDQSRAERLGHVMVKDVPEFLPGEMQSRTPSKVLAPWESMPEAAAVRQTQRDAVTRNNAWRLGATNEDAMFAQALKERQIKAAHALRKRQATAEIDALIDELFSGGRQPRTVGMPVTGDLAL